MLRWIFFTMGWLSLALAVAGAVLPVIPCTPFALLAALCFARSSPAALERLRQSPLVGPALRDWERYHGLRLRAKIVAAVVAIAAPAITFAMNPHFSVALAISMLGGLVAIVVVCRLPTIPASADDTPANADATADDVRRAA